MFSQSDVRPHSCPMCESKFKYAHNMRKHMRTHEDSFTEKTHSCRVCENKSFARRHLLQKHMQKEHGVMELKSQPNFLAELEKNA